MSPVTVSGICTPAPSRTRYNRFAVKPFGFEVEKVDENDRGVVKMGNGGGKQVRLGGDGRSSIASCASGPLGCRRGAAGAYQPTAERFSRPRASHKLSSGSIRSARMASHNHPAVASTGVSPAAAGAATR